MASEAAKALKNRMYEAALVRVKDKTSPSPEDEIDAAVAPLVEALQEFCDGFPGVDQCGIGEPYLCAPACKHCKATKKAQKALETWRT